jgi:hypothetical protein
MSAFRLANAALFLLVYCGSALVVCFVGASILQTAWRGWRSRRDGQDRA